jgi:hypothetical protein
MRAVMIVALLANAAHAEPPGMVQPRSAPIQLTAEEDELIDDGEMSGQRIAGGVILATAVSLGTGQLVEGHYFAGGLFAAIDVAAYAGVIATHGEVKGDVGPGNFWIAALMVSKIVQIVDASVYPGRYNRRVRAARVKAGLPAVDATLVPFVAPRTGGAVAGLTLQF